MRRLERNRTITIFGRKIGNTYIRTSNERSYPIENPQWSKYYKDYEDYWWVLQKNYFQWRVLKVLKSNKLSVFEILRIKFKGDNKCVATLLQQTSFSNLDVKEMKNRIVISWII